MTSDKKFAVLIDADNVSAKYIKFILDEVANDGIATYKRIYGDWTSTNLSPWKAVLLDNSITPVQQYGYTTGKNATDSAMIIDAMDILHSNYVEGFYLISSDSDFTRLASRLRESGMYVVGMGEKKTLKPFIAACNKFKYLDVLAQPTPKEKPAVVEKLRTKTVRTQPNEALPIPAPEVLEILTEAPEMTALETIRDAIVTIVAENSDEEGWVSVGDIGNRLIKRYPDFDVRNFGFSKLTRFISSLNLFEIKSERSKGSSSKLFSVRAK